MEMAITTAERVGLHPVFDVMFGHPLWLTILICWAITPGMMIVIGIVGESRLIPLSPKRQFISFFPGDLLLGLGVAPLIQVAPKLPDELRWYNAPAFHMLVFAVAAVIAALLTKMEYKQGLYPPRAVFSPTKLYHNGILYVGYGSLGAILLSACLATGIWRGETFLIALAVGGAGSWLVALLYESTVTKKDAIAKKARHAHIPNWKPIWVFDT